MREKITEGKTKRVYKINEKLVEIVSKKFITAEDGEKKSEFEDKDVIANNTTCNVFELLGRNGIETHFVKRESDNSFIAKLCEMIPIEVVIRRIATGSYLRRNPKCKDGKIFTDLVVEFFHKDDKLHDPIILIPLTFHGEGRLYKPKEPIGVNTYIGTVSLFCSKEELDYMKEIARQTFSVLEDALRKLSIRLWDLKMEFGRDHTGKLVVADVIDNDSWRIRTKDGKQLDKQLYRDGKDIETVKSSYQIVSELTNRFNQEKHFN